MNLEVCSQKKLSRAEPEQLDEIYKHFYNCRKWFPHIRKDYVDRHIYNNQVIYDDGVIIIFNKYKRKTRLGDVTAQAGDVILHQILNPYRNDYDVKANKEAIENGTYPSVKGRAERILKQFCEEMNTNVWLSVRADNNRAIAFYNKLGFEEVSKISWMQGKLKGLVFVKRK